MPPHSMGAPRAAAISWASPASRCEGLSWVKLVGSRITQAVSVSASQNSTRPSYRGDLVAADRDRAAAGELRHRPRRPRPFGEGRDFFDMHLASPDLDPIQGPASEEAHHPPAADLDQPPDASLRHLRFRIRMYFIQEGLPMLTVIRGEASFFTDLTVPKSKFTQDRNCSWNDTRQSLFQCPSLFSGTTAARACASGRIRSVDSCLPAFRAPAARPVCRWRAAPRDREERLAHSDPSSRAAIASRRQYSAPEDRRRPIPPPRRASVSSHKEAESTSPSTLRIAVGVVPIPRDRVVGRSAEHVDVAVAVAATPVGEALRGMEGKQHRDMFEKFAATCALPDRRVHCVEWLPGIKLPEPTSAESIGLIVMGAITRQGLGGSDIGSTAERVLDRRGRDLLVVKPARHAAGAEQPPG